MITFLLDTSSPSSLTACEENLQMDLKACKHLATFFFNVVITLNSVTVAMFSFHQMESVASLEKKGLKASSFN